VGGREEELTKEIGCVFGYKEMIPSVDKHFIFIRLTVNVKI
jgi:hypothetical protein